MFKTKTSFLFLYLAESVKILVRPHAGCLTADMFVVLTGIYFRDSFHKNKKRMVGRFTLKLEYLC